MKLYYNNPYMYKSEYYGKKTYKRKNNSIYDKDMSRKNFMK